MSKVIRASALVLLLACSAQAGWIQNGSPAPPPPQPANTIQEPTAGSATQDETEANLQNEVEATLTDAALSLLGSVLAMF